MPDHNNRQVKSNAVSNQSADNIEDGLSKIVADFIINFLIVGGFLALRVLGALDAINFGKSKLVTNVVDFCKLVSHVGLWIEAFWRLKIHDPQEQGGMAQSSPYPDRPGVPDCGYYLRTGSCGYGNIH
ncbi:hypothetical protein SADUNF_Sadunf02G0178700 [Salix dunnii]|uniref:Uncharacterized protein n=1 Tax=Salix dunnii TaxID=1413687 RepID=A0A835TIQ5_9ROSI|nr:hypothetical protein SADUNF_Sadunf02G0178700 [Salix dunnii]